MRVCRHCLRVFQTRPQLLSHARRCPQTALPDAPLGTRDRHRWIVHPWGGVRGVTEETPLVMGGFKEYKWERLGRPHQQPLRRLLKSEKRTDALARALSTRGERGGDSRGCECCECCVCMSGGVDLALPCGHALHAACAAAWWRTTTLSATLNCPLCRADFDVEIDSEGRAALARKPRCADCGLLLPHEGACWVGERERAATVVTDDFSRSAVRDASVAADPKNCHGFYGNTTRKTAEQHKPRRHRLMRHTYGGGRRHGGGGGGRTR